MFDPLTQDLWVTPLVGVEAHLWKAGSPTSVCGKPWEMAAQAWDCCIDRPTTYYCKRCAGEAHA